MMRLFLELGKAIEDCYVIAKYDYVAQGSQELSLRKNDKKAVKLNWVWKQ